MCYNMIMLFSSQLSTIEHAEARAAQEGRLNHTRSQLMLGEHVSEPLPYFVADERTPMLGRSVVGFVQLDKRGYLEETPRAVSGVYKQIPRLYAVLPEILEQQDALADNPAAQKVAREYQVIAEDLSMRRGVLNRYGRSSAERVMLRKITGSHRPGYVAARLSHLEAVRDYINAPEQVSMHDAEVRKLAELATLEALVIVRDAA
jgi:hypothetical protein